MRKRVTTIALLCSLRAPGAVESGARISLPPNSQQTGRFSFANRCPSDQTFRVTAQPPADWLSFEPATVNAGPNASFDVRVTVKTSPAAKPGAFQSGILVVCASCAASEPPCLQEAAEFPISLTVVSLTVADMKAPGDFQPVAAPPAPTAQAAPASGPATRTAPPKPIAPPGAARPAIPRFLLLIGGGILAAGVVAMLWAVRGLSSTPPRGAAESQRHRVRR